MALSKSDTSSKGQAKSMAELMALHAKMPVLQKGSVVEGVVKKLTPKEITLDIGFKSDALVLEFDKKNLENLLKLLHVGDKVQAVVLSPESEEGFPVVSLRRTLETLILSRLEDIYRKNSPLEVAISESTRGGFFAITSEGVRGFLPTSQILRDFTIIGKTVKVKIIEFDREKKRVIFSEKATVYVTDPQEIERYIEKDKIVKVTVENVAPYGLYVVISPKEGVTIEGFVHISELSYQRIEKIQDIYKKHDVIDAFVLGIDQENRRVNLSIKKLEKDNFEDINQNYAKDKTVKGVVQEVRTRGVTLELEAGVFGFISATKIPTGVSYQKGEAVEAEVTGVDEKRRLVLLTPILKAKPIGYR